VDQGRQIFGEVGLPTPEIFETPHYSATREAYYGIGEHYPVRYERGWVGPWCRWWPSTTSG